MLPASGCDRTGRQMQLFNAIEEKTTPLNMRREPLIPTFSPLGWGEGDEARAAVLTITLNRIPGILPAVRSQLFRRVASSLL